MIEEYRQRSPIFKAKQFRPNDFNQQIPSDVNPFYVGGKCIIGSVSVQESTIYIYPGDWLVYNGIGLPSHTINEKQFLNTYEKVT